MPRAAKKKPRKKPTAVALAPRTKKAEPSEQRGLTYVASRSAGVRVNEDTALTLGAVFACCKVITEDIAGLPWHVKEQRKSGGSDDRPEDPADWLISTQANPECPAFQWRETILAHALTWGNGYAEIERDGAGRPLWLWLLTPDRVCPERAVDGRIVYEVRNPTGSPTVLESEDVFHLRGLGFDGLKGYSVIQLAARSIGAGIALDQSTADLFGNDSTPGGLLTHPNRLSDLARNNLVASWERRHQGPSNRRRMAILEEGMKWEQTGLPPEDTKLIEQRQFTPADICRWFRVSPVKIQDLLRATFSNIEELAIWHVTDTLLPWARRLETEANIKLFGRTNRGKRFTKLNLHGLLRGNTAAQTSHITSMLNVGVYSINDSRAYLDQNPIGPDGDKRFVPMNMQLLEKAGEDPPEPRPDQQPDKPSDPNSDPSQPSDNGKQPPADPNESQPNLRAALRPVFEDVCRRVLRAESERAKGVLKSGAGKIDGWLEKIRDDHAVYVRSQLRPAASAIALLCGISPEGIEAALGIVAGRHLEGFQARLQKAAIEPTVTPIWEAQAADLAVVMMGQVYAACGAAGVVRANEPKQSATQLT